MSSILTSNEIFNVTKKYVTVVRFTQIAILDRFKVMLLKKFPTEVIRSEVYPEYSQSAFTFQSNMRIPEQYTKYVQS